MVYIRELTIRTGRDSYEVITAQINRVITESGIENGIAVVESSDTGVGILRIADLTDEVVEDINREMRRLVPARINFSNQDSPENTAGRIKGCFFGSSVSLIVKDGKLLSRGKQDVCFADYDGPQDRTYSVCVYGE